LIWKNHLFTKLDLINHSLNGLNDDILLLLLQKYIIELILLQYISCSTYNKYSYSSQSIKSNHLLLLLLFFWKTLQYIKFENFIFLIIQKKRHFIFIKNERNFMPYEQFIWNRFAKLKISSFFSRINRKKL
jgi:hypothetical protein